MCGICGFTGNIANKEAVLTCMMNKIIHRGPDSAGQLITDNVALGFRRLSIIDLDHGDQPMYNEDRTLAVTFNGEIYNYRTLRDELEKKGHVFANNADTEVLLHAYEEYGPDMLNMLRGMFSFVIWDLKTNTMFGARDFFGIKPFYYTIVNNNLIYASEIKSILEHPDYEKKMNPKALENYMTFQYSVLEETFFQGIFKLMPGHYFIFKDGKMEITRYFDPIFEPDEECDEDELVNRLNVVLQDSIYAHMFSDVEVGSFLSSGVDSGYVASSFKGRQTFTVGFNYSGYNEIDYAKDLTDEIGLKNHNKLISSKEFWGIIPKVQYHMDEPLADAAAIGLYFVNETAAKHVKVALSGEGADEFFGGYPIYHEPISVQKAQKLPMGFLKKTSSTMDKIPFNFKGKNYIRRASQTIEERFIGNAFIFTEEERNRILKNPTGNYNHKTLTKPYYDKVKDLDDITKMQYIDVNMWMVGDILLKTDKMSMAHSLEVRVPYLDKEVFNVAKNIPTRLRIKGNVTKYAFREAAHSYLPDIVADRAKLGFPVPIRIWLRKEKYYNVVKSAFESDAANEYFNVDEIMKLLDDHFSNKVDNSRKIWVIYIFLIWYEQFFGDKNKESD